MFGLCCGCADAGAAMTDVNDASSPSQTFLPMLMVDFVRTDC
jgi:hypothetical protein